MIQQESDMEMMNRAIEDASDFSDMLKKLQEAVPLRREVDHGQDLQPPPKLPGENREQYRKRIYGGKP